MSIVWLALLGALLPSVLTFRWLFPGSREELWNQGLMLVLEHFLGAWLYTWVAVKFVVWLLLTLAYGLAVYSLLRFIGW